MLWMIWYALARCLLLLHRTTAPEGNENYSNGSSQVKGGSCCPISAQLYNKTHTPPILSRGELL